MNVAVEIHVGTFSAEVTVTDTGPDGMHDAVQRCREIVLDTVGAEACAEAAAALWVEADANP